MRREPCSCSPRSSCGDGGPRRAGTVTRSRCGDACWTPTRPSTPGSGRCSVPAWPTSCSRCPTTTPLPPRPRPPSDAAREDGAGEDERIRVLQVAITALQRPELRARRVPLYDELVELATRQGEHAALANTLTQRAVELRRPGPAGPVPLGRGPGPRAGASPRPPGDTDRHRAPGGAGPRGGLRLGRAGQVLDETDELEGTLRSNSVGLTLVHRAVIAEEQGRLGDLEPALEHVRLFHPMMRELHALALVRAGRADRAREVLGAGASSRPWPGTTSRSGSTRCAAAPGSPWRTRRPSRTCAPASLRTPTSSGSPPS